MKGFRFNHRMFFYQNANIDSVNEAEKEKMNGATAASLFIF